MSYSRSHRGSLRVVGLTKRIKKEQAILNVGEPRQIETGDWILYKNGKPTWRSVTPERAEELRYQQQKAREIIASCEAKLQKLR